MIQFRSAGYLGFDHSTSTLRPWSRFATGMPAAMSESSMSTRLADRLATLVGSKAGVLSSSTLHLSWDLFKVLSKYSIAIYWDRGIYPILKWGIERVAKEEVPIYAVNPHCVQSLSSMLKRHRRHRKMPLVVADGWCTRCGRASPLKEYLEVVRKYKGLLLIDDTQALGVLGKNPSTNMPYGYGGGGSCKWLGIEDDNVIIIGSLGKGLGVPISVLAGCDEVIRDFRRYSETRVHCSPPSTAAIYAAEHALYKNRHEGDERRERLIAGVKYFRQSILELGMEVRGGLFPVQLLELDEKGLAFELYRKLVKSNIRPVLLQSREDRAQEIAFIFSANHTKKQIDRVTNRLAALRPHKHHMYYV